MIPENPTGVCPHDGAPSPSQSPRYWDALCRGCVDRAADAEGRSVSLFNTSLSGGFLAQHRDDGSECASVTRSGIVFIDAVAFDAAEARFGGIVVRPRSPQES